MPYVSSVERMALKKGIEQGIEQGVKKSLLESIALDLELKFGPSGLGLLTTIMELHDIERLRAVFLAAKTASSLDQINRLLH